MSDLTDFLLARIAEDDGVARDVRRYTPDVGVIEIIEIHLSRRDGGETRSKIVRPYRPERVLAECEAKRRIVEEITDGGRYSPSHEGARILPLLALPYADHPEYREEWKP